MFLPSNSPLALAIPLILIEISSFLIKPISLGLRLAANLAAGHLLLALGSSFIHFLFCTSITTILISVFPLILLFVLMFLELAVSLIQSYVFVLLTILYLKDSIVLH